MAEIPLFIALDQEGGHVSRLNEGFSKSSGNKTLGASQNPELAKQAAFVIGQEMRAVGINMNFAPVVDIACNRETSMMKNRSFGDNPNIVIQFGSKAVEGYKAAGIIATLKHYPGHGDVTVDSHCDLPILNKSMQELQEMELLPFSTLHESVDAIMTAHLLVPAFDSENCSTLSKPTLDYLRNNIGYQGLIISDSLIMEGVLKKCNTVDEAAISAFNAGCDILLLGGKLLIGSQTNLELTVADIQRIHASLVQAVKTGRITHERLNQSVERILIRKTKTSQG
jgi:beta-N-acetylhexosaminidase